MDKLQKGSTPHLFLSYSWNDSELADRIDGELSSYGFDVKRDIRDIGSWKSIKEFMSSIRNQDYAVIIISSSYLKSPNCMYEIMELLKDSQYKDKVLSIVTEDADIYNPISRANYIKYWEEETQKLEEAIKPLKIENTVELTVELRKYRSIETTIASFLDLVSDKNNPKVINAVEKIKEIVNTNSLAASSTVKEKSKKNLKINVEAYHYAFLKFASLTDLSGTEFEKKVGIKKLDENVKQDLYDLPMLKCEVTNCSEQIIKIQEPRIKGAIALKKMVVNEIGFFLKSEPEKVLEPGAKTSFVLYGAVIIDVIKAFFDNKIESIYVEDNFGFRYYASLSQIEEATKYFRKYCSNPIELQLKHDTYYI